MKIIQDIMTILEPDEGYILTDGDIFTDRVYLGAGASPDDWYEVVREEVSPNELSLEDSLSDIELV